MDAADAACINKPAVEISANLTLRTASYFDDSYHATIEFLFFSFFSCLNW